MRGGCARSPTRASTARRARRRSTRFERDEAAALRPLDGRPPFRQVRELVRRVKTECTIELDTNSYSVPWRLIGETVAVVVGRRAGQHPPCRRRGRRPCRGRRAAAAGDGRSGAPHGVAGLARPRPLGAPPAGPGARRRPSAELLRPLAEYEQARRGRLVDERPTTTRSPPG